MADLQAATSVRAPEARLALLSQAARQYIRRGYRGGVFSTHQEGWSCML